MSNEKLSGEEIYDKIRGPAIKFYNKHKSTIPVCLDEEDFIQEVALRVIKYGDINPYYACMDIYRKFLPLDYRAYEDYLENNPYPQSVPFQKIFNLENEKLNQDMQNSVELSNIFDKNLEISENVRYILYRRYFLGCTLEEIAKEFGVTNQNISLIEKNAIKQIRQQLKLEDDE